MVLLLLLLPQDILTDLSLVPTSLDPEGIAERAWLPRRQAQAPTGPAKLEAAVVRPGAGMHAVPAPLRCPCHAAVVRGEHQG